MAIEKLKDLTTGWRKLGKTAKWGIVLATLFVLALLVRGLELVGILPDSRVPAAPLETSTEDTLLKKPKAEHEAEPAPPAEAISTQDARLRLPTGLDRYVMVALGDPRWTTADPTSAAVARFVREDGNDRITVRVAKDAQSFEDLGLARAQRVKVGALEGRQTIDADAKDAAIHWRRGALLLQVFAHGDPFDGKRSLAEALRAAETVNRVADGADSLSAEERAARIVNLGNAIDAKKAAHLTIASFGKSLPPWAVSAQAGPEERGITVTVAVLWLAVDSKIREAQARELWQRWAAIAAPGAPDTAHLTLVDTTGKKVGGSGIIGSSISVR